MKNKKIAKGISLSTKHSKAGFTLLELLIIIAIMGILITVIIITSLLSARERAKDTAYVSYASSLKKALIAAVNSGSFDGIPATQYGCLGNYTHAAGDQCWSGSPTWEITNATLDNAFKNIGEIPDGQQSPYKKNYGTIYSVLPSSRIVRMYVAVKDSDDMKTNDVCTKIFGSGQYTIGGTGNYYCFTNIPY